MYSAFTALGYSKQPSSHKSSPEADGWEKEYEPLLSLHRSTSYCNIREVSHDAVDSPGSRSRSIGSSSEGENLSACESESQFRSLGNSAVSAFEQESNLFTGAPPAAPAFFFGSTADSCTPPKNFLPKIAGGVSLLRSAPTAMRFGQRKQSAQYQLYRGNYF
ncbi:hypothetical protein TNCV_2432841 [Trichonephila clavipes]|nr:hypothetical protein TNCV_2432841 [Trichonephila clavipes]